MRLQRKKNGETILKRAVPGLKKRFDAGFAPCGDCNCQPFLFRIYGWIIPVSRRKEFDFSLPVFAMTRLEVRKTAKRVAGGRNKEIYGMRRTGRTVLPAEEISSRYHQKSRPEGLLFIKSVLMILFCSLLLSTG